MRKSSTDFVKSFSRRKGKKISDRQKNLLKTLLPKLEIKDDFIPANDKPIHLEIGFGGGEHLAHQAALHPDIQFIGCEPFINGVAKLLVHIEENNISNILIYPNDARDFLIKLPENIIAKIHLLFPDPWPKRRDHKKRILNQKSLNLFAKILKPSGFLRVITDHADYSDWINKHLSEHPNFVENKHADFSDHIQTRYQAKAEAANRKINYYEYQLI